MARFADIARGTRATKIVRLPLGDDVVPVRLRVLASGELAQVLERTRADARARGVDEPRDGNPIYDLCEMEHTLAFACLDADAPEQSAVPFFSGVEEIRRSPELGRDRIAYLYEQWQVFQDEVSPSLRTMSPAELVGAMQKLALEDDGDALAFFGSLGPGLRWSCMRTLARLWLASLTPSSPSSSLSEQSSSDEQKPSAPADA